MTIEEMIGHLTTTPPTPIQKPLLGEHSTLEQVFPRESIYNHYQTPQGPQTYYVRLKISGIELI